MRSTTTITKRQIKTRENFTDKESGFRRNRESRQKNRRLRIDENNPTQHKNHGVPEERKKKNLNQQILGENMKEITRNRNITLQKKKVKYKREK